MGEVSTQTRRQVACSKAYRTHPMITKEEVMQMAREANLPACHTTHPKALERFAQLVATHTYAKQLTLPKPKLTGKFSITGGKFKCTGCTGTWTAREDAKHHSCKDYQ